MIGRTRILVTHQVGLCLTKADYVVSLENGNVEFSGNAKELKDSGTLEMILKESNNEMEFEDIIETETEDIQSNNSSDSTLRESSTATTDEISIEQEHYQGKSEITVASNYQNENGDSVTPRKLIKDEGK